MMLMDLGRLFFGLVLMHKLASIERRNCGGEKLLETPPKTSFRLLNI
jgi:hypothetical protein